jgi:hypothetical protein
VRSSFKKKLNVFSTFLIPGCHFYKARWMMLEKFWNIEEESSYKEQAYNKHLQRLRNYLSEDARQFETISEPVVEHEQIKIKWSCYKTHSLSINKQLT